MTLRQIGLVLGGLFLLVSIFIEPFQTLVYGWIGFLARVLPRFAADLPTVLVAIIAVALFTGGLHWVARAWKPSWRWRYSVALSALMFVMFAAGVGIVGLFHMTAWLAADKRAVRVPGLISGAAARVSQRNNMKQIAMGMHNYASTYHQLPRGGRFDPSGRAIHGWEIELGPYYAPGFWSPKLDLSIPWDAPENEQFFRCVIPEFINPCLHDAPHADERGFGFNHYSANSHVFRADRGLKFEEITDGTATTILFGEINANFQPWGKPMNVRDPAKGINRSPYGFGGPPFAGGALFAMADGSVRFIRESVSRDVLRALATPNGGEAIDPSVLEGP